MRSVSQPPLCLCDNSRFEQAVILGADWSEACSTLLCSQVPPPWTGLIGQNSKLRWVGNPTLFMASIGIFQLPATLSSIVSGGSGTVATGCNCRPPQDWVSSHSGNNQSTLAVDSTVPANPTNNRNTWIDSSAHSLFMYNLHKHKLCPQILYCEKNTE